MAKAIIQNFGAGILNDPRDTTLGASRMVSNFDVITSPNRLIPYRSSEDGNSNASNDLMQNWCIALRTGTTYSLYGLGRQTATNKVRVFYKNLTTSSPNDLDDNGWTETSNNLGTQVHSTNGMNLFVYYRNQELIFGAHSGYIWSYDPTGVAVFGDTLQALSYTNIAQGIVHSKDDVLYIPYDNKIASKNGSGAFNLTALTLPSQYYITCISEFNNYIAIAAAPLDGISNSRVYIWDRSTTLTTITENIDWGYGQIKVLDEIGGYLVGISLDGSTNNSRFNDRVTFRYYTGSGAISFREYLGGTAGSVLVQTKQKINGRIHFCMSVTLNGTVREGVWSFGKTPNGNGFNLVHERTPNNDTALGGGALRGFFYVGDYLFQAFTTNAGTHTVSKTDDTPTYSATSIYESIINEGMASQDKIKSKKLNSISVGYKSLSGISGQVVVKYRVDGATSYTTICTCTTTGVNVLEFKDAAGVPFTDGREYEFRIESTLGADVIELEYDYSVIPTLA